jgi:hypothetical protein
MQKDSTACHYSVSKGFGKHSTEKQAVGVMIPPTVMW